MKLSNLVLPFALAGLAVTASCSQEGLDNVNTSGKGSGASSGSGMGPMGGTGGSMGGTGGSMGGSSGSGPSNGGTGPAGMGGGAGTATTMGGSAGTVTTMGGSAGTVTTMGGSAGTVTTMGGSAGTVTTMGGSAGMAAGGMPAGGMAGSGMAGMGAAGMGGGLTPQEIVPDLHPFYWEGTCSGDPSVTQATGHNCPMTGTLTSPPANGVNSEKVIMVKGTSGQTYTINIEVRGVIGTRCYTGGMRASSAGLSEDGNNNWWYVGGSYANPTGWWNTYELKVAPSTGDPSGDIYYFNGSGVQGGNDCEREATYLVKYNASFKAKGGGTLTFKIHDQNGKGQQNCGKETDPNSPCSPRTVDLTGMAASPPASLKQPPANALEKTYYPQWMLIAVTSITSP